MCHLKQFLCLIFGIKAATRDHFHLQEIFSTNRLIILSIKWQNTVKNGRYSDLKTQRTNSRKLKDIKYIKMFTFLRYKITDFRQKKVTN